ncbi:MAG: VCBS repeat-containing protein [Planctomycetota bacterium]
MSAMYRAKTLACTLTLGSLSTHVLCAQEEVWRIWSSIDNYDRPSSYGDYNGDGVTDVLVFVTADPFGPNYQTVVRIHSGANGALLFERTFGFGGSYSGTAPVGDLNGDGYPEYAIGFTGSVGILQVISPLQTAPLWIAYGPSLGGFGGRTIGLTVDNGTNNMVVTTTSGSGSTTGGQGSHVFAYDHNGILRYSINLLLTNSLIQGLGNIGDIDSDGADDFGVGLIDTTSLGAVQIYSGRTGIPIRRDFGTQINDYIGRQVVAMGDFDRDGVPDYAASNRIGGRGVAIAFSGASGQVLREWSGNPGIAERLLGGLDLDLDGVPDVFVGGPNTWNGQNPPGNDWYGRIQALSGRDGGLLWDEWNWPTNTEPGAIYLNFRDLGDGLVNLGRLPGSPYPVVLVWDWPYKIINPIGPVASHSPRLRAIRVGLAGTAVQGTGCASTGSPPQIAVRRDLGGLRVTLSGATPGSAAWLLVGPRVGTAWQGMALPYPLASWGLPGCSLLVPPDIIFARSTGTTGWDAGYTLVTAPFQVATMGLGISAQWFCFHPSTLDFSMSPRHELWIQ